MTLLSPNEGSYHSKAYFTGGMFIFGYAQDGIRHTGPASVIRNKRSNKKC